MHASRSESALFAGSPTRPGHGSSNGVTAGTGPGRLTPVHGHRARTSLGSRGSPFEEKQYSSPAARQQYQPPFATSKSTRLVDATGRPFDTPDIAANILAATRPTPQPRAKFDSEGLPMLPLLSATGVHARDGDMSAMLLSKVSRASASNLAALSAARGSPLEKRSGTSRRSNGDAARIAADPARMGMSRTSPPYQLTGTGGRATLASDGRAAEAELPSSRGQKLRVTDFSGDGGMGGRVLQSLSMEAPADSMADSDLNDPSRLDDTDFGLPDFHGGPPHLQSLAKGMGEQSAMLRSQLRGLDLLSTAFGQLIDEVGGSRGQLSRLLTRVRENYRLLFSGLVDNVLELHSQYHAGLRGCVADYKQLQLRMDGKVAHLEQRVRLLTSVSASKDHMLALGEAGARSLESEVRELRETFLDKSAVLKVETASNAIRSDTTRDQHAAMQLLTAAAAATATDRQAGEPSGIDAATGGGEDAESTSDSAAHSFAHSSSVDALTSLSHESRNLTFELSELIQSVEVQQTRSAATLAHLDALLDKGVVHVDEIAQEAAKRQAAGAASRKSSKLFSPNTFPSFPTVAATTAAAAAAPLVALSSSPSSPTITQPQAASQPRDAFTITESVKMSVEPSSVVASPLSPGMMTPGEQPPPLDEQTTDDPPSIQEHDEEASTTHTSRDHSRQSSVATVSTDGAGGGGGGVSSRSAAGPPSGRTTEEVRHRLEAAATNHT